MANICYKKGAYKCSGCPHIIKENGLTVCGLSKYLSSLVGKTIRIINMEGEPQYTGRSGIVKFIDSASQIHGTWGGCAIHEGIDSYIVEK